MGEIIVNFNKWLNFCFYKIKTTNLFIVKMKKKFNLYPKIRYQISFSLSLGIFLNAPFAWSATSPYDFLNPVLTESLTYDDNVFRVSSPSMLRKESQMADFINRASATVNVNNTFGRQIVDLNLQVDDNYYFSNTSLNHISTQDSAVLKWHLTDKLFGKLGADFNRSLAGFANTQFLSADILSSSSYYFDSSYQLNSNWRFDAGVKESQTMHSAASRTNQNTNSQTIHAGITFMTASANSIGIDYSFRNSEFPNRPLNSRYDNAFQENFGKILLKYNYSPKLNFEAQAGYKFRNYQHLSKLDFHGEVWRITATYSPTTRTLLTLSGWHEPTSFIELESNYYISEGVSFSPSWFVTEKIVLSGQVKMESQNRASNGVASSLALRNDELFSAGLNINYNINNFSKLGLAYQFYQRDSNRKFYGYVDDTIMATFQFKF